MAIKQRFMFLCLIALLGVLGLGAPVHAIEDVRDGKLFGYSHVDVGGRLYNVEFIDSSCVAIFGGCDHPSDFDFTDVGSATLAAIALRDQVLIDISIFGAFDRNPNLTNGCSSTLVCAFHIPTSLASNQQVTGITFANASDILVTNGDLITTFSAGVADDMSKSSARVYAKFTLMPVDEPAALSLMLGGGIVLGVVALLRRGRPGSTGS